MTRNTRAVANFNPRTPVGCDDIKEAVMVDETEISIHAPQWGATNGKRKASPERAISIHAPQWGATALFGLCQI